MPAGKTGIEWALTTKFSCGTACVVVTGWAVVLAQVTSQSCLWLSEVKIMLPVIFSYVSKGNVLPGCFHLCLQSSCLTSKAVLRMWSASQTYSKFKCYTPQAELELQLINPVQNQNETTQPSVQARGITTCTVWLSLRKIFCSFSWCREIFDPCCFGEEHSAAFLRGNVINYHQLLTEKEGLQTSAWSGILRRAAPQLCSPLSSAS